MNPRDELINYWKQYSIITDKDAINAFKNVKREIFVPEVFAKEAYQDRPLPLMEGQTISQPTTVMLMTQALSVRQGMSVLEIGTGSGYQSAILSKLTGPKGKVYSIEKSAQLHNFAKENLKKAGISGVTLIHGDGSIGYPEKAPYDRIIVTAAAPMLPPNMLGQLKLDGILVIPIGTGYQQMMKFTYHLDKIDEQNLGDFSFVPLKGEYGFK